MKYNHTGQVESKRKKQKFDPVVSQPSQPELPTIHSRHTPVGPGPGWKMHDLDFEYYLLFPPKQKHDFDFPIEKMQVETLEDLRRAKSPIHRSHR